MVRSFYAQKVAMGKEKGSLIGQLLYFILTLPTYRQVLWSSFTVSLLRLHSEVSPEGMQRSYSQCQDLTTGHLHHPQPRPTTTRHMTEHWATVKQGFSLFWGTAGSHSKGSPNSWSKHPCGEFGGSRKKGGLWLTFSGPSSLHVHAPVLLCVLDITSTKNSIY